MAWEEFKEAVEKTELWAGAEREAAKRLNELLEKINDDSQAKDEILIQDFVEAKFFCAEISDSLRKAKENLKAVCKNAAKKYYLAYGLKDKENQK